MRSRRSLIAKTPRARRATGLVGVVVWAFVAVACGAQEGPPLETRLRVTLGANEPVAWVGRMSVEGGRLEKLQPLNVDARAASALWLEADGELKIDHREALQRDSWDVTVRHHPGDTLRFEALRDGETVEASLPLDALRRGRQSATLDAIAGWIVAERLEADRLRIRTARETLIFDPGEEFCFGVEADPPGILPAGAFDLSTALIRESDGLAVWDGGPHRLETPIASDGAPGVESFCVPMPAEEGVYRVVVRATRPPGFTQRFMPKAKAKQLIERSFQVLVLDGKSTPAAPGGWRESYAFNPGSHSWRDRLPDWIGWRRMPWIEAGPISSHQEQQDAGGLQRLPAAPENGSAHWRAFPLPIARPGEPHLIEVETPTDGPQQLTVSLLDADAFGAPRPLGEGVAVETPRWNRNGKTRVCRLVVWPRSNSPLLVLSNPSTDREARFGKVRVFESTGPTESPEAAGDRSDRIVAIDWSTADLPRAIGVRHAAGAGGGYETPDLRTFYQTARRLADRVRLSGGNAAVIDASASGATIYPSQTHSGSPLWDLGVWGDGAADLPRQPMLELLLREFDRCGLRLILATRFDAALPVLERGADDESSQAYNPYDPATHAAQKAVIDELVDRGRPHPSFAGVAIRLGEGDWSLTPADGAGHDAETVNRFLSAQGVGWPEGIERTPEARERVLESNTTEAWTSWRSDLLATGMRELASSVQQSAPESVGLIVLPSADFSSGVLRVAPHLGTGDTASESPIALSVLAQVADDLSIAQTEGSSLSAPLNRFALESASIERLSKRVLGDSPAEVCARIGSRRMVRLVESSRLLAGGEEDLVVTTLSAPDRGDGFAGPRRLGSRVVIDGSAAAAGWLDRDATNLRRRLCATPIAPASERDFTQSVGAFSYDGPGGGCVVATNPTPWPATIAWTVRTDRRVLATQIDHERRSGWYEPGEHSMRETLAPFSTLAWRFSESGVRVVGVRHEPNERGQAELAEAQADLQSRDTSIRRTFDRLANASFEANGASETECPGWTLRACRAIDSTDAADGGRCLRLAPEGAETAVAISDAFPMPATGQLVIALRVRGWSPSDESKLSVVLEQVDGDYRNQTAVSGVALAGTPEAPSGGQWREVLFPVDDLPLTANGRLRLRIEGVGAGLEVDDLRVEDLVLPLGAYATADLRDEKLALVRLQQAAAGALSEGRLEDCRRLLDGYWPRFLMTHFPAAEPTPEAVATEAGEASEDDPPAEEEPASLSDRVRSYLPRFWR